jgi:hypothetical protein
LIEFLRKASISKCQGADSGDDGSDPSEVEQNNFNRNGWNKIKKTNLESLKMNYLIKIILKSNA